MPSTIEVVAPNFKRRLSGVTSTIIQLIPEQCRQGLDIVTLGPGLPEQLPNIGLLQLIGLWSRPQKGAWRIWHARRNPEMIAGIVMRDILRMPLKLLFTSAAQRHHKPFTKWLIRKMDRVVATNHKSASYLDVDNQIVMHGIDIHRFDQPDNKPALKTELGLDPNHNHIGCFGRVRHQKGTDLFVRAMIELLPDNPGWTALISGRVTVEHTEFHRQLENEISEAGLTDRIRFIGEVDDIRPWYQALNLYVAPSRNEGFGLTPLEAMACGVPVVASDAGAYDELVVDGQTGHWVPADDGPALTKAIGRILCNAGRLKSMSDASRPHVKSNFALEGEAGKLISIYREMQGPQP